MSEETAEQSSGHPGFTGSDGEPLVGKSEREKFLGWEPTPKQPEPEEKTYEVFDGVAEAARDHAAERPTSQPDIIVRKQHRPADAPPGAKIATTVRQAADELAADHKFEQTVHDVLETDDIQKTVDVGRLLMAKVEAGEISFEQAVALEPQLHAALANEQWQPQAEAPVEQPQPEAPPEQPTGIDPDVAAALQNPKVRAAVEAAVAPAEQARSTYANATAELAAVATASVVAQFPELQKFSAHELPAVLNYMSQQDPGRYQEIMSHLSRTQAIVNANNQARQLQAAQHQAHLREYARREGEAFDRMIAPEATPERRAAVQAEVKNFAKEAGLSMEQLGVIFQQNPVLNSAMFQRIFWDAALHRSAVRTAKANPASRNQIPQVQKPGIGREELIMSVKKHEDTCRRSAS
jgi:hypothetical protein